MRVWHPRAPALRYARPSPFTVGRGPVPRHASVGRKMALVGVRFSRGSGTRGEQAPALRLSRPPPFHRRARACPSPCLGRGNGVGWRSVFARVGHSRGTGPRATVCKAVSFHRRARACPSPCLDRNGKAWVCVRFPRRSCDRGGQAPALRARKGFASPYAVRDQAIPNYGLLLQSC